MKKNVYSLILIFMVLPVFLQAQEKLTLTLEKSIDLALENNPGIKMAEKEVAKSKAGVGEAWSNVLPQLDASANLSHNWKIQSQTIPNFLKPMLGPLAPPGSQEHRSGHLAGVARHPESRALSRPWMWP